MSTAQADLLKDLEIVTMMAELMEAYLVSDLLFKPTPDLPGAPPLTPGNFLLRRHRLFALQEQFLNADQRQNLAEAAAQFDNETRKRPQIFQAKTNRELKNRANQWRDYLKEMEEDFVPAFYNNQVETRAIIQALVDRFAGSPDVLDSNALELVAELDSQLQLHWQDGKFVWDEGWQPAYPQQKYWWLYGTFE
jgi:hypothetical protein